VIPKAKNPITLRIEPSIALNVPCVLGMLPTIDLDNETSFVTDEVDDEAADQRLAPETQAIEAMRSQRGPKTVLGIRHAAAQRLGASALKFRDGPMGGRVTPLPDRFAVRPPPQGGR